MMRITFADEAYETRDHMLKNLIGYVVTVRTLRYGSNHPRVVSIMVLSTKEGTLVVKPFCAVDDPTGWPKETALAKAFEIEVDDITEIEVA